MLFILSFSVCVSLPLSPLFHSLFPSRSARICSIVKSTVGQNKQRTREPIRAAAEDALRQQLYECLRQVANLLLLPDWKPLRILGVFKLNFIWLFLLLFFVVCCEIFLEIRWVFRFLFHKINIYNVSGLWHVSVIQQSCPIDLTFWQSVQSSVVSWESNTISTNFLFIRMRQQFFYCKDTCIYTYIHMSAIYMSIFILYTVA